MEFTDYELYQILDENDYAPSAENLQILKENPEILDEFYITRKGLGKEISKDTYRIDRINDALADKNLSNWRTKRLKAELEKKTARLNKNNNKVSSLLARDKTDAALKVKEGMQDQNSIEKEKNSAMADLRKEMETNDNQGRLQRANDINAHWKSKKQGSASFARTSSTGTGTDTSTRTGTGTGTDTSTRTGTGTGTGSERREGETLGEAIELLFDLLEQNGFESSEENLNILCEGILNDEVGILDSSDIVLTEGMDEDYVYMQLLDNNGFEVTEHNIDVLKEAIDNGHILLTE